MSDRHALPPYSLRMTADLRAKLEASAAKIKRSLNAEIIARLEESSGLATPNAGLSLSRVLPILGVGSPHRIRHQGSTYGALEDLLDLIRNAGNIGEVWLAVREGEYNHSALTLVMSIDKFILLADTTLLTIERRARETEVQDLTLNLDKLGLLDGATSFLGNRVQKTGELSPKDAVTYLANQSRVPLTRNSFPEFLNLFLERPTTFTEKNIGEYFAE